MIEWQAGGLTLDFRGHGGMQWIDHCGQLAAIAVLELPDDEVFADGLAGGQVEHAAYRFGRLRAASGGFDRTLFAMANFFISTVASDTSSRSILRTPSHETATPISREMTTQAASSR